MRWLVIVTIVAVLLIGPALALLYRLDMTDRLVADHDADLTGRHRPTVDGWASVGPQSQEKVPDCVSAEPDNMTRNTG